MKPLLDRIKDRCKVDEEGCWVWTQGVNEIGYPTMSVAELSRSPIYVRRLVFTVACGPLHARRRVYSTCENKLCCNPEHLKAATESELAKTEFRQERQARGERHSLAIRTAKRSWKLDATKAAEIRRMRSEGVPRKEVAALFGINECMVSNITSGKAWRETNPWSV
jgi:hypothetical protein